MMQMIAGAAAAGSVSMLSPTPAVAQEVPYQHATLLNATGLGLVPGDVVAISTSSNNAVTTVENPYSRQVFVVAVEIIPNNAYGRFAVSGFVLAKVFTPAGGVVAGEYVIKHPGLRYVTNSQVLRLNTYPNLPPPPGALGHAVGPSFNGFVPCFWYDTPSDTFTILNAHEFYEDFESTAAVFVGGPVGANEQWKYAWFRASGADVNTSYGVMRVSGDGNAPSFKLLGPGGVFATPFTLSVANGPLVFEIRQGQVGVAAGTRRLGLSGTAIATADPANGIFLRYTVSGQIFAVARTGGVETAVDTVDVALNGSFSTIKLIYDGGTKVHIFVSGTWRGVITSNVPVGVALGISGGNSVGTNANGFDIDAIHVQRARVVP